jgi:hypothetical protein
MTPRSLHRREKQAVWGNPFSGTPIRYDDLTVAVVEPSK